jgi:N-acetylmuramidase
VKIVEHFTRRELEMAANAIQVDLAALLAVAEVEAGTRGLFGADGMPTILFERHLFHRFTGGRWSRSHSSISNPLPGGYGKFSDQWPKLRRARELDRDAANRATSWGAWQVLGDNWKAVRFASIDDFVEAMVFPDGQLRAFVGFIRSTTGLAHAIRIKDAKEIARLYNGPGYRRNQYDEKIAAALIDAGRFVRSWAG